RRCDARQESMPPPQMQAPPPAIVAPEDVRSGGKGRRAEEVELARSSGVKPRTPRLANRAPRGLVGRRDDGRRGGGVNGLIGLDIGRADHFLPFRNVILNSGGKLVRCADDRLEAKRGQLFLDARLAQDVTDLPVKQRNYRRWRMRGDKNSEYRI